MATIGHPPLEGRELFMLSKHNSSLRCSIIGPQRDLIDISQKTFEQLNRQRTLEGKQDKFSTIDKSLRATSDQKLLEIFLQQFDSLEQFGWDGEDFVYELFTQIPAEIYTRINSWIQEREDCNLILFFFLLRDRGYINFHESFDFTSLEKAPPKVQADRIRTLLSFRIPELSKIERLDLTNGQLMVLPPEISMLSNLKELILSHNEFNVFPKGLSQLPNLEVLDLSHNKIKMEYRPVPSPEKYPEIRQLKTLKKLNLSHNKIWIITPELFSLNALEELDLSHNLVSDIEREIIDLDNLKKLNLSHNGINRIIPELFSLNALEEIDLSYNTITSTPDEIPQSKQLKSINLRNTKIENAYPGYSSLKFLIYLCKNVLLKIEDNVLTDIKGRIQQRENWAETCD